MKKTFNIRERFLSIVLCAILILSFIPITQFMAVADAPDTIQTKSRGDSLNYFYYQSGGNVWFDSKVALIDGKEQFVYCLDSSKPFGFGSYTTYSKTSTTLNPAVQFILANGILSPNAYANPSTKDTYMTGDTDKDYYITAAAIHVFDEGPDLNHSSVKCNDASMLAKFKKLIADAQAQLTRGATTFSATPSISASPANQDFVLNGNYYETNWYTVSIVGDLKEYDVIFKNGKPANMEILNASGNVVSTLTPSDTRFKLRIHKNNVSSNLTVDIRVRGLFNSLVAYRYTHSSSTYQPIGIPFNDSTQHLAQNYVSAQLFALGNISLSKTSEDGIVSGIQFRVTGNGVDTTVTTSATGSINIPDLLAGTYTITEVTPDRYLTPQSQTVTVSAGGTATVTFNNVLKKGKVSILKQKANGSTGFVEPEEGAVFRIYLKSAGSYDNASATQRDEMTSDEHGYLISKDLPYGTYTVEQTVANTGYELMEDFDVNITENSKTYHYIINNAQITIPVKIVKKDIETGNIIPASGIGFKVRDVNTGEFIKLKVIYPTPMEIDEFYTGADGTLMLPEQLPFGSYELIETATADGYVLDSAPVPFVIDGTQTTITVEKSNIAQKAIVKIMKKGEVLKTVNQTAGGYELVYEVQGLAGATYEIKAFEDIVTLDGTKRASAGDVVATITTGADGVATSPKLYLGKYVFKETVAPNGMTIDDTDYEFELVYEGQETEFYDISKEHTNTRKKVEVSLEKLLELNEEFNIGTNGEIEDVCFGLFANEDIVAIDGEKIPAGELIEKAFVSSDGSLSFLSANLLPQGKYFVQEVATNEHYILDDTKYEFEFSYDDFDTEILEIKLNDGEPIDNDLIYGSVSGLKVDDNDKPLAGAMIGIFKKDVTEFTEENAIDTFTTESDGAFRFENLPFGDYYVCEISAPNGYILNEKLYAVSVAENEEIIEVTIQNNTAKGSLKIIKRSSDEKLHGFSFKVTGVTVLGEAYEKIFVTDKDGIIIIEDLLIGEYTVSEVENDQTIGYILPKDKTVTITANNQAEVEMVNTRIPRTGDRVNYIAPLALITSLFVVLLIFGSKKFASYLK